MDVSMTDNSSFSDMSDMSDMSLYKYNEVIINPPVAIRGILEDFDNTDFTLPNLPYTYD